MEWMYVVGAAVLSNFWRDYPHCEGELRALHAVLADSSADELNDMLRTTEADGRGLAIDLAVTRVLVDINAAAQVARIANVAIRKAD